MMFMHELLKANYFNDLKPEFVNPGGNAAGQKAWRAEQ